MQELPKDYSNLEERNLYATSRSNDSGAFNVNACNVHTVDMTNCIKSWTDSPGLAFHSPTTVLKVRAIWSKEATQPR